MSQYVAIEDAVQLECIPKFSQIFCNRKIEKFRFQKYLVRQTLTKMQVVLVDCQKKKVQAIDCGTWQIHGEWFLWPWDQMNED